MGPNKHWWGSSILYSTSTLSVLLSLTPAYVLLSSLAGLTIRIAGPKLGTK